MAFTRETADYDIIQALDRLPSGDTRPDFDTAGNQIKTFVNDTLISELENDTLGTSAAESIGYPNATYNTLYAIIENILSAGSGTIPPDDTITYAKLDSILKSIADNTPLLAAVASQALTVTIPLASQDKFILNLPSNVSGGQITINGDNLNEYDGTGVTSLDAGYYDIIKEAGEYVLMSATFKGYKNVEIVDHASLVALTVTGSGTLIQLMGQGSSTVAGPCDMSSLIIDGVEKLSSNVRFSATDSNEGMSTASMDLNAKFTSGFEIDLADVGPGIQVVYSLD